MEEEPFFGMWDGACCDIPIKTVKDDDEVGR
jgi:hypothetical protein